MVRRYYGVTGEREKNVEILVVGQKVFEHINALFCIYAFHIDNIYTSWNGSMASRLATPISLGFSWPLTNKSPPFENWRRSWRSNSCCFLSSFFFWILLVNPDDENS